MSKSWQPYAQHILDAIAKIQRIQARGDLTQDEGAENSWVSAGDIVVIRRWVDAAVRK